MANRYGFAGVNQQLNVTQFTNPDIENQVALLSQKIISARVTDIILDESHPEFENQGGWLSVGTVFFQPVNESNLSTINGPSAKPLLPYLKNYPLVNEVILLFLLPDKNIGSNNSTTTYYYLNPIAVWNNQHMNGYPNLLKQQTTQDTENKSYQEIQDGQTRKSTEEEVNVDFNSPIVGGTFVERSNVHPLLAYAGDIIMEGRWGNSIRFGSTVQVDSNDWSVNGENGTIINRRRAVSSTIRVAWRCWRPTIVKFCTCLCLNCNVDMYSTSSNYTCNNTIVFKL